MAKHASGGSKATQKGNVAGKRLGLKVYGGQLIKAGQIILRQRGTRYLASTNVGVGNDHTLYSRITGRVEFFSDSNKRTAVKVVNKSKVK
jgi:large subunit ribosomal protein L27